MTATCLHCEGDCRLTNGAEIYPPRSTSITSISMSVTNVTPE